MIDHQAGEGGPPANVSPTTPTAGASILFPESPSKQRESYAMIDFNRTAALSNATRIPLNLADEEERKTRHDKERKTRHDSTLDPNQ